MAKLRSIKLPDGLIEEIKSFIEEHSEFGYLNHSEFVRAATRRLLEELKEKTKKSN